MTAAPRRRRTGGEASSDGNGRPASPSSSATCSGSRRPLAKLEQQIHELEARAGRQAGRLLAGAAPAPHNYTSLLRKTYENLTAWETVQVARHPQRPLFKDYVEIVCREFRELHGDRRYGDDPAIMCGLARMAGHKVMLIGHHKGRDTKEKVRCSFGLAHPEGYRKALRCMKLAEKFGLPVVCLIDTAGAYPGHRGGGARAGREHRPEPAGDEPAEDADRRVITGEGGSGGALGIGVADRVAMMEHAWYSVISPEGCSGILWKGNENAPTRPRR
jgi:acetyl-CoA carboxylase carboxyl transferase subunit alpha